MHEYSEDALIEQPTIALFAALGWQTVNCYHERFGENGTLGRETPTEVVLLPPAARRPGKAQPRRAE